MGAENRRITAFADGASSGNPGPSGWGAVVVVASGDTATVTELGGGEESSTNNRMELMAAIEALRFLRDEQGAVDLYTDSTYVIRGITQWIWAWRTKDWKTAEGKDVLNVDLWRRLSALVTARGKERPVRWHYVRGHSGIPGNERVDEIAVAFSQGRRPTLFRGPLLRYGIAVHDLPESTELPEPKPRAGPKAPAYSYLSMVNGQVARHRTWAECEARVKGRSGAKFKKATSPSDEDEILRAWGAVRPPSDRRD